MTGDRAGAQAQVERLAQQAESVRQIARELLAYRSGLNGNWTAREMTDINRVIDDLHARSGRLAVHLDALCADIALAMEELEAESAAAAAIGGEEDGIH